MNTYNVQMRSRKRKNGKKVVVTIEATDCRDASQRTRIEHPLQIDILIQLVSGQEALPTLRMIDVNPAES